MAKPGDTRKSATGATYIWTGRSWAPVPKLKAQQQAQRKQIAEANAKGTWLSEWWRRATSEGPESKAPNAERSWKSRGAQSGTVVLAMRNAGNQRRAGYGASTTTSQSLKPKKVDKKPEKKDVKKPATTTTSSPSRPASSTTSAPRKKSTAPSAAGGGRKPSVSQSRTMWVKKGDVVGGQTVKKGYLAQYGKPEKRVTARVRAEAGNAAGMKAGSVTRYKAGRKAKKGK
jgi:hypothetical protein